MNTAYCTVYCTAHCTVHCTVHCTALFSVQVHCLFCVVHDMMRGESFRWRRIDTGSLLHSRNVWNFELYTAHCTLHTSYHCTPYTVHWPAHYKLHTARWTQHIIADCTMYTDLHTVTNIIQTAHWPAHFTQNTAHMPHCTLHTDLHTAHKTIICAHLAWWYPCDNHWLAQTMFLILDLHCTVLHWTSTYLAELYQELKHILVKKPAK